MYKWKNHPPCFTANSRYNTPCSGAEERLSSGIIPDLHCCGWNEKLTHSAYITAGVTWYFFFLGRSCSSSAWTATHVWPSVTWPSCITCSTNMSWKIVPYLKSLKLEYSIRGCRGMYQTQSREFVMDRMKIIILALRPTIIMLFEGVMEEKTF